MNKKNVFARLLAVPVVIGVSTATLFLWQALIAQQRPQIKQTIKVDAASTKKLDAAQRESHSGSLIFAGSGGNLPILIPLVKEFRQSHPHVKIDVPASIGSSGGIQAAADGAIAIGLTSRPLKDEEKKLGLTVIPYAQTALVIGAHPSVTDDGITTDELIQIYQGKKSRWRDGHEIIVLTRDPEESSIKLLEQEIPGFKEAYAESQQAKRWSTVYQDKEMNKLLTRTPYAIGLSEMGTIAIERLPIKALSFNGMSPTPENVKSGSYPLVKTLSFVFLKHKLPSDAKTFLDFVQSQKGEKILRANGYLPAK